MCSQRADLERLGLGRRPARAQPAGEDRKRTWVSRLHAVQAAQVGRQAVAQEQIGRLAAAFGQECLQALERVRLGAVEHEPAVGAGRWLEGRADAVMVVAVPDLLTAPSAVIFDFNGTLSSDEPLLARLFVQIFGEAGIQVTEQTYWDEYAGFSDPEIVRRVLARAGRSDSEVARSLLERRARLYLEQVAVCSPITAEAAEFARRVADRVPVAIASGAARVEIEAALRLGRPGRSLPGHSCQRGHHPRQARPGGLPTGPAAPERRGRRAPAGGRRAGVRGLGGGPDRGPRGRHAVRGGGGHGRPERAGRGRCGSVSPRLVYTTCGGLEVGMRSEARAVVIGGGVGGCSILYHLARKGWTDTVLVEQYQLTHGSTWHSAGLVGQLRSTVSLTKMMQYSVGLYAELAAETGKDPGWHELGGLRLASSQERYEEIQRQAGWAKSFGLPIEIVSPGRGEGDVSADVHRRASRRRPSCRMTATSIPVS